MEMPNVRSSLRDEKNGITYHVMAYRQLSSGELMMAVRHYLASRPSKQRPKAGDTVTIVTIIGLHQ
jgi:hypothetical protein